MRSTAETGGILSRDREAEWNGTAASGSSNTGSTSSTGSTGNTSSTTSASTTDIGEAKPRALPQSRRHLRERHQLHLCQEGLGRWALGL